MPASNGRFLQSDDQPSPLPSSVLPPWLASSGTGSTAAPMVLPPSPSVTLSLSPLPVPQPWLPSSGITSNSLSMENTTLISGIMECCRELKEGHRALTAHRKEAAWRLKHVELQLESEKASKRRDKMEDIEAKINALREEQKGALDRIKSEYREQLLGLRREVEAKEQKLSEQWTSKHVRLMKFLEQLGCRELLQKIMEDEIQANNRFSFESKEGIRDEEPAILPLPSSNDEQLV